MKFYAFEGTSEEFSSVAQFFKPSGPIDGRTFRTPEKTHVEVTDAHSRVGEENFGATFKASSVDVESVTVEEALVVLRRRGLSDNIRNVLTALYKAGSKTLTSEQLQKLNHHNADQ